MRVGIDYLPAVTHAPGVGRYARELVHALVRLPREDSSPELRLFQVGWQRPTIGEPALGLEGAARPPRVTRARVPRRLVRWSGLGADRWLGGVDVFHRIHADWPPVRRALEVQPVSELPTEGSAADAAWRDHLRRVAGVLVFSAHAGREVERRYGVEAARVHQVPVGCEHWRRVLPEPPEREERPPTIVALGAVRAERRHAALARAFDGLWRRQVAGRLYVLGSPGDASDAFESALAGLESREQIHWIPRPSEGQIPGLVARAACVVHLAESELTPVTPLEALSFGTPVVASDIPAFAEALGDEVERISNDAVDADVAVLEAALERAVESAWDSDACARREALAARFPWSGNAAATVALWERVRAGGAR